MSRGRAWLVILASLVLGTVAGNLFVRSAGPALQLSMSCLLLSSAEQAGYIDAGKRNDLIDRVSSSRNIDAREREAATKLRNQCPKV